jgi:hypothetical protein
MPESPQKGKHDQSRGEDPLAVADGTAHVNVRAERSTFGREARTTTNEADKLGDAILPDLFNGISRGQDDWL